MKKIILAVILSLSYLITPSNLFAEDPPCWPDYPSSTWTMDTHERISMSNFGEGCEDCYIWIDYWYREVIIPPGILLFKDVQLGEIRLSAGCLDCVGLTISELYKFSIDYILTHNPLLPVPPPEDTCEEFWRAVNSACWGEWEEGDSTVILQCQPIKCCWKLYEVCLDSGVYTYELLDSYDIDNECYISPHPCQFTCDLAPEPPPGKIPLKINENKIDLEEIIINPNPSTSEVEIVFNSNQLGEGEIKINDLYGNSILKNKFIKNNYEKVIKLNLINPNNGTYYVTIFINDLKVARGTFIILK